VNLPIDRVQGWIGTALTLVDVVATPWLAATGKHRWRDQIMADSIRKITSKAGRRRPVPVHHRRVQADGKRD
jgi:hypothetical protein